MPTKSHKNETKSADNKSAKTAEETKPADDEKSVDEQKPAETAASETAVNSEEQQLNEATENSATSESSDEEDKKAHKSKDEPVVKSGYKKVRVKDFRGTFGDAKFNDDCVCDAISDETLAILNKQFPGAEIEEL